MEREIVAEAYGEVGTKSRNTEAWRGEAPTSGFGNEDSDSNEAGSDGSMNVDASNDESSHTYYFGASTITLGQIHEMAKKGYFAEGEARVAGE
jgi:hypothetical protein